MARQAWVQLLGLREAGAPATYNPKGLPNTTGAPLPLRKQANQTLGRASFQFSAASIRAQGP